MLIGIRGSDLLQIGFGPFDLGFFLGGNAGDDVDGRSVPGGVGLLEIGAVGSGEGLFYAEVDAGDRLKVVLGGGENLDCGKD